MNATLYYPLSVCISLVLPKGGTTVTPWSRQGHMFPNFSHLLDLCNATSLLTLNELNDTVAWLCNTPGGRLPYETDGDARRKF